MSHRLKPVLHQLAAAYDCPTGIDHLGRYAPISSPQSIRYSSNDAPFGSANRRVLSRSTVSILVRNRMAAAAGDPSGTGLDKAADESQD